MSVQSHRFFIDQEAKCILLISLIDLCGLKNIKIIAHFFCICPDSQESHFLLRRLTFGGKNEIAILLFFSLLEKELTYAIGAAHKKTELKEMTAADKRYLFHSLLLCATLVDIDIFYSSMALSAN